MRQPEQAGAACDARRPHHRSVIGQQVRERGVAMPSRELAPASEPPTDAAPARSLHGGVHEVLGVELGRRSAAVARPVDLEHVVE